MYMIKINNKEYKFKLGFKALRMFQDETSMDLSEIGKNLKLSTILDLAYYGMVSQGEKITKQEIEDAIDESPELLTTISNAMTEGMAAFNGLSVEAKK